MKQYIDKSAVMAEIKHYLQFIPEHTNGFIEGEEHAYRTILSLLDTLEVKEALECKEPEYSCFETIYKCGKKPHWNIGDTLAYFEFYSDREGEHIFGKVTKVEFDEEQYDWFYTFEDGSAYDEQTLLEEQTYKRK